MPAGPDDIFCHSIKGCLECRKRQDVHPDGDQADDETPMTSPLSAAGILYPKDRPESASFRPSHLKFHLWKAQHHFRGRPRNLQGQLLEALITIGRHRREAVP